MINSNKIIRATISQNTLNACKKTSFFEPFHIMRKKIHMSANSNGNKNKSIEAN